MTRMGLSSELRSDALSVSTVDFLELQPMTHTAQMVYSNQ